eukprot:SAG11_NODE_1744_length_4334_cov_32.676033_3_plen_37_part_00
MMFVREMYRPADHAYAVIVGREEARRDRAPLGQDGQ